MRSTWAALFQICCLAATAMAAEIAIDPAGFPADSRYAEDALSQDWGNAPGKVTELSYWTDSSTKYFTADSSDNYTLQSRRLSRDQEVETWGRSFRAYLRLTDSGKCFVFEYNGEAPSGHFSVRILTGERAGSFYSSYYATCFQTLDLASIVPEYHASGTDQDRFLFGVEGFDVYARYNGYEFLRFREYRHMEPGRVALRGPQGYGFRKTVATFREPEKPLLSDTQNLVLDLRDFGWRSLHATGSIRAGSNLLRLDSPPDPPIARGDYLIVELGGEAGHGLRGTIGVGGTWPSMRYSDPAARDSDHSQLPNTYAWIESDGSVRQWNGSGWLDVSTWINQTITPPTTNSTYYPAKAVPVALRAYVMDVSSDGLSLALSRPAQAASSNAAVHFDNAFVFNKLGRNPTYDGEETYPFQAKQGGIPFDFRAITPSNVTLRLPAGDFAVGEQLHVYEHPGWRVVGAGPEQTRIFSPRGVPSASIGIYFSPRAEVRDLHILGNARNEGFGLDFPRLFVEGGVVKEDRFPQSPFPPGLRLGQGSHGSRAVNVRATDVFPPAIGAAFADDVWAVDCQVVSTEGQRSYTGWFYLWSDSSGGGATNCSFSSPELSAAWAAFKATGATFVDCVSTNGVMAFNSAGGFLVRDTSFVIHPGSSPRDGVYSSYSPIVNINSNIGDPTYLAQGGVLENVHMVQLGYINSDNDTLGGIVINEHNPNIRVLGGSYIAPDYALPSKLNGAIGLGSTGVGAFVKGFRVVGRGTDWLGNLFVRDGIVIDCFADWITTRGSLAARVEDCHPSSNVPPFFGTPYGGVAPRFDGNLDIGSELNPLVQGSFTVRDDGSAEMRAGGASSTLNDAGHFAYVRMSGDFDMSVRIALQEDASPNIYSAAGLMLRDGLTPDAAMLWVQAFRREYALILRLARGAHYAELPQLTRPTFPPFPYAWLRLRRANNVFSAYYSVGHGKYWKTLGEATAAFPRSVYVGLAASAGMNEEGKVCRAVFADFQLYRRSPESQATWPEGGIVRIPFQAHDMNQPLQLLTYRLLGDVPDGLVVDSLTGEVAWTPSEAHGPGTNVIEVIVEDDGVPKLTDTNKVAIVVTEVNSAPILASMEDPTVDEGSLIALSCVASDADVPRQELRFTLGESAPVGARISPEGLFEWTPSEAQGPGAYPITVRVTDDGIPSLQDEHLFTVKVREVNTAPTTAAVGDLSADVGHTLSFDVRAADPDIPANVLRFVLRPDSPEGMKLTSDGSLTWTPTEEHGGSTYRITFDVIDDGTPSLQEAASFNVSVAQFPPIIRLREPRLNQSGGFTFQWSALPGRSYQVQFKNSLDDPAWTGSQTPISSSETIAFFHEDVVRGSRRFYRVVLLP